MGKRAKEHRKKVQKRNARIKQMQTSFNNKLQKMLTEKLGEYQKEIESKKNLESNEGETFEPEVDSAGFTHEDNFIDIVEVKDVETEINN
jgi:hypothetical protein